MMTRILVVLAVTCSLASAQPVIGKQGPPMQRAREHHTALSLLDGRVVVLNGLDDDLKHLEALEAFDPAAKAWTSLAPMKQGHHTGAAAVLHDGSILVVAGSRRVDDYWEASGNERWDPKTNTWKALPDTGLRASHRITVLTDGRALIAGGQRGGNVRPANLVFDPATNTFTDAGALAMPRMSHALIALPNGAAAVIGGLGGERLDPTDSIEVWDPATRTWKIVAHLANARSGHTATVLADGRVLVAGGGSGNEPNGGPKNKFVAATEVCDFKTNTCTQVGSLGLPRSSHRAVRLGDGRVLVIGGHVGDPKNPDTTASIEVFGGTSWKPLGRLRKPRNDHTATLLGNGSVLITGGCDEHCTAVFRDVELVKP